ncbi:hypothetical protein GYMLUDRAFT_61020 [Collybiopsis luxurians FD-317 M1]|uniref:Fe2OG dioxygenase domain-containing protein n=1 Tax=Collybiopsis luxurians FD-317 M1 TaxID=944289 RepID=A0A0D0CQY7_9AGAR|nr:hypothetical protein GYMLUDRAFT_61020 [Collybiopsis luxurians FD-317 M1]
MASLSRLPIPYESDENFVHIISGLLSDTECDAIIQKHSADMVPHNLTLTRRLRSVFEDEELSNTIWERLNPFYGNINITDEKGCRWLASGCNARFRFCRYEQDCGFEPHIDGRRLASIDSQSFMTVNIYLKSVPPEDGGSTRVLSPSALEDGTYPVLGQVHPVKGSAAVFRDSLFHDGENLRRGVKYLLRTDIMFSREVPFDLDAACAGLESKAKGTLALEMAVRLEDGNNSAEAMQWYRKAYKLCPELEFAGTD